METEYSTEYFRSRLMGQALQAPFDLRSPALKAYRRAARMLLVQPGMRILDAGCGLGTGAWLLAMLGAQVTGLDVSSAAIAWAQATYGGVALRKGGSLHFAEMDLTTWPPHPAYDAIVVADVIEHFPRPAGVALLRRLLAALDIGEQPAARGWVEGLFLHLPITANLIDWPLLVKNRLVLKRLRGHVIDHHGDPTHVVRYSVRDVPRLAREAGGQICGAELRVYKPRLRWLEPLLLAGASTARLRLGSAVVTDCDAIVLPELVAALRMAAATPAEGLPDLEPGG
ncbi:MAG TPA: class I SAM-dependent methyltransferase [Chloroflexia bacterium]|nr:class I SAM-dependent methyltransferase [Chloroflexia bacterium]